MVAELGSPGSVSVSGPLPEAPGPGELVLRGSPKVSRSRSTRLAQGTNAWWGNRLDWEVQPEDCSTMARVMIRAGKVPDNVEADSINVEKYVKELAALMADLTKAAGMMFEQGHLRMINMVMAIHVGGSGGPGG